MKHFPLKIFLLSLGVLVFLVLFFTYETYGNWTFALLLRGKKVAAFVIVALLTSTSTLVFQTLSHNKFLTPGVLGIDQLYVTVQTLLFFLLGGTTILGEKSLGLFFLNVFLMSFLSVLFITFFMGKSGKDLFSLLMVGMIASTLFSSLSTFLQVLMDPNEYELLQGKLFASFSNVSSDHLVISLVLTMIIIGCFWYVTPELDVLRLGQDMGVNLGINVLKLQKILLFLISAATGVATALVGPTIFLGFVVATITYEIFPRGSHKQLFLGVSLIGILFLIGGQFLIEHVFQFSATMSTVIQFSGGLFFIGKIILERKKA